MSLESAIEMLDNFNNQEAATQGQSTEAVAPAVPNSGLSEEVVTQETPVLQKAATEESPQSSLSLLAKAEALARSREKDLKSRIDQLESAHRQAEEQIREYSSKWDNLKKKPLPVLDQELGHGWYQNISNEILGKQTTPDEEIKYLKDKDSTFDERVDQKARSVVKELMSQREQEESRQKNIQTYIEEGRRLALESQDIVFSKDFDEEDFREEYWDTANKHHLKTNEVLTPAEVLLKMEEKYQGRLKKSVANAKFETLFGERFKEKYSSAQKPTPAQTLNSGFKQAPLSNSSVGPEDRIARAARVWDELSARR